MSWLDWQQVYMYRVYMQPWKTTGTETIDMRLNLVAANVQGAEPGFAYSEVRANCIKMRHFHPRTSVSHTIESFTNLYFQKINDKMYDVS